MNWNDPDAVANFITAVTPAAVAGLLALSGTILLFWLQQAAVRREEKRVRLASAFEDLLALALTADTVLTAARTTNQKQLEGMAIEMSAASWKFAWNLKRREAPIATWMLKKIQTGLARMQEALHEGDPSQVTAATLDVGDMLAALNAYRVGERRLGWFKKQNRAAGLRGKQGFVSADRSKL